MSHTRELDGAWAGTCWLKRSYDIDSRKLKVSYMALVLPQSGSFYPVFSPPPPRESPSFPSHSITYPLDTTPVRPEHTQDIPGMTPRDMHPTPCLYTGDHTRITYPAS